MNNKLWFACPSCYLAFYSKGEYEQHHERDHPGRRVKDASLIETRG